MARIIPYYQQVDPSVGRSGRYVNAEPLRIAKSGFASEGAESLRQGVNRLASALKEREEEDARAWTAKAMSETRLKWTEDMIIRQQSAAPGAPDFTPNLLRDFDAYASETIEKAPTPSSKRFLQERLDEFKANLGGTALSFEAQARIDWRTDQFNTSISNTQKLMNTDPSQYNVAMAEILATIDSAQLPPLKKSAIREKAMNDISAAAVWSQIQKSPSGFLNSIGFGAVDGKTRRTSGDLTGITGNTAFDALPFDKRAQLFGQAIQLKTQIDTDAEAAARAKKTQLADESAKEAWNLIFAGNTRKAREYIENVARPVVNASTYHSLKLALEQKLKGDGAGPRTDPGTFRELQVLIRDGKFDEAGDFALRAHRNGLLSNEHLSSSLDRARSQSRQEGPRSEYERSRNYIVTQLDPGPFVQDPLGKARFGEAIDTFDRWVNGAQRTDKEIMERGREIVNQFRFTNMSDTIMALPSPRSGSIRRTPQDVNGILQDILKANKEAERRYQTKRYTLQELEEEQRILERWRRAVLGGQNAAR